MNKISSPIEVLNRVFGYEQFRPSQEDVINAVVEGRDGLVVLTTGGGKSLCYQVPALCLEGTTVVVSPLISLMKDQVDALQRKGVSAAQLNSSMSDIEIADVENQLKEGKLKLLYVSPEKLAIPEFVDLLKTVKIPLFAIDEAHCISTWGRDFRLSYTRISRALNELEEAKGERIPRFGYTATATPEIREDIQNQLELKDPFVQVGDFDRPNIEFSVKESINKFSDIIDILNERPGEPTIIYTATVKAGEELTKALNRLGANAGLYHGRLTAEEKKQAQDDFLNNKTNVMIATNAFGMGVDKSNIRNVIHYQMPQNLENYFQEAGRAGRDGLQSRAILLYSDRDRGLQDFFIRSTFPDIEAIEFVLEYIKSSSELTTFNINSEVVANKSNGVLKDSQFESVLRILDDQGLISYKGIEGSRSDFSVSVLDLNKELCLEPLAERKKKVIDNLNSMDRYCKTNLCRRRYIIRYFGTRLEHKNCNTCDVCMSINKEKERLNSLVEKSDIKKILKTVTDTQEKYDSKRIVDILLGVNSTAMQRRGLTALDGFGVLKNSSKTEAEAIIKKLEDEKYIMLSKREPGVIKLTEKAKRELEQNAVTIKSGVIKGYSNPKDSETSAKKESQKPDFIDIELFEKLTKARRFFASGKGVLPVTVFSDDTLKIMSSNPPKTINDLEKAGITPGGVRDFGERLLKLVDNHLEKKQSADKEPVI